MPDRSRTSRKNAPTVVPVAPRHGVLAPRNVFIHRVQRGASYALALVALGHVWQGIGLMLFCGLIIGSVDNLLRPILVGRDTKMHELMIFFSTLGGLLAFGAMGFIIGPVLAALFLTVWEIFGAMFRAELRDAPPLVVLDSHEPQ